MTEEVECAAGAVVASPPNRRAGLPYFVSRLARFGGLDYECEPEFADWRLRDR